MKIVSRLFLASILNILWTMPGYTAPLLDTKDNWSQNVFAPVIKTACSSDGQCWDWLPMSEISPDDTVIISEGNSDVSKLQSRRQIAKPTSEFALKSWKDRMLEEAGRAIRPSLAINKQIPSRIMKKDIFVSRRGVGGMPFSVLYMNPHGTRSNHIVTATSSTVLRGQESATTENPISSIGHPMSRVIPRNGQSTMQPRKQYWTIPQLFISYGWGPLGK